ncbi:hypothetical protein CRH09_06950 [Nocardia terpenica]|uniref:Uncharacterized protein n=1 Tax=Nocardia terpenica TaxID=455432 RepID=A0A291REH7_9NOCA|nr:hypothetical protein CRH09_06950 [Nocardia terpenica]
MVVRVDGQDVGGQHQQGCGQADEHFGGAQGRVEGEGVVGNGHGYGGPDRFDGTRVLDKERCQGLGLVLP